MNTHPDARPTRYQANGSTSTAARIQPHPTHMFSTVVQLMAFRLLSTCTWTADAVWSAVRVVELVKEPRARQKALYLFLGSAQRTAATLSRSTTDVDKCFFDGVIHLVLAGTADLWSAIRKDSARAGAKLAACFPFPELVDAYIGKLIRTISAVDSSSGAWTKQEGALLGIYELLKAITLERRDPRELDMVAQGRVVDDILGALADRERERFTTTFRVGHGLRLDRLPRGVVTSLKPALYRCLQHDQLTIRQKAAESLLAFAFLCDVSTCMAIFQETVSKLNRIPDDTTESTGSMLLGAFEAEGLLDVLAKIVAALPLGFLVKHWGVIFPTLERYVIHIASSVRQKSSAVILALAQLSSKCCQEPTGSPSNEAALSLLVQMLLSLSVERDTERVLCWQKEEGRLLSVDVLVNFLGQDILRHDYLSCSQRDIVVGAEGGGDKYRWAHDQLASATWILDSEEDSSCRSQHRWMSIVRRVDLWISEHASKHNLPSTGALFWQKVCRGWVDQLEAGLASVQFELQRISKQVLPGLMRLCIWLDQTQVVQGAIIEKQPTAPGVWTWLCVKYLLLHLRYLYEGKTTLADAVTEAKLTKDEDIVWETGIQLLWSDVGDAVDAEVLVAKVETLSMMAAHYSAPRKPLDTLLDILDAVLVHVHAALPSVFRVAGITTTNYNGDARYSATLDRQFCMSLTRTLPAMSRRLTDQRACGDCSLSPSGVEGQRQRLTPRERWLVLERTALAWLRSDDMMRWICVPKSTGRIQLVESLSLLVQIPPESMTRDEVRSEFDRIVQAGSLLVVDQPEIASQVMVADMLIAMWIKWSGKINLPANELVVVMAGICASAQSAASSKKSLPGADAGVSESWDDWDDEETRPTTANAGEDASIDGGFSAVLTRLEGIAATRLVAAAGEALAHVDSLGQRDLHVEQFAQRLQEHLCIKTAPDE